jgi:uncharacterized membrane protein YciS (DUF1049 family)
MTRIRSYLRDRMFDAMFIAGLVAGVLWCSVIYLKEFAQGEDLRNS